MTISRQADEGPGDQSPGSAGGETCRTPRGSQSLLLVGTFPCTEDCLPPYHADSRVAQNCSLETVWEVRICQGFWPPDWSTQVGWDGQVRSPLDNSPQRRQPRSWAISPQVQGEGAECTAWARDTRIEPRAATCQRPSRLTQANVTPGMRHGL